MLLLFYAVTNSKRGLVLYPLSFSSAARRGGPGTHSVFNTGITLQLVLCGIYLRHTVCDIKPVILTHKRHALWESQRWDVFIH